MALRPWEHADLDDLVAAWADPEVGRWTAVPDDRGPDAAARWIAGERHRREAGLALDLVGVSVDDGRILGEVGLSGFDVVRRAARIGWWTAAPERGHGVATGMVRLLTRWAHDGPLALSAVVAEVDPGNPASAAVARAAGYSLLEGATGRDGPVVLAFASRRPAAGTTGGRESSTRV